jgi:hypothetical protein
MARRGPPLTSGQAYADGDRLRHGNRSSGMNVRGTMRGTRVLLMATVGLSMLAAACTGGSSEGATTSASSSMPPPTGPLSQASPPQPVNCPRHWDYSPVDGSDSAMVPGVPSVAVSCNVTKRRVITGPHLARLVQLLNSRPLLPLNKCIHNLGGLVFVSTQLYFSYATGDLQLVNVDRNCRTVSNGKLTAEFARFKY